MFQNDKNQLSLSKFIERKSRRVSTYNLKFPSKELEQIAKSLDGPLDIYQLIIESRKPVDISIPPTLIRLQSADSIFLKTVKDSVKTVSKNAVYEFFNYPQNPSGLPLYFYSEKTTQKICFTEKSGINFWETSPNPSQIIQKYLANTFKVPTKLRVYWKATEGPRYYLIKNLQTFPKVMVSHDKSLDEILTTKYKHNLIDYPYAGQIFKSSFNHFMPQKSELKSNNRLIRKKFVEQVKQEMFKCKCSGENASIISTETVDKSVTNMMENIVSLINNVIGRTDKKVVTDLVIDFIQDDQGIWYFLKCKAHKFDFLPTKCPIFLGIDKKKSILNLEFARGFYESMISTRGKNLKSSANRNALSMSSIRKRLDSISTKISDIKHSNPKISLLTMDKDKMISNYIKNSISYQKPFKSARKLNDNIEVHQVISQVYLHTKTGSLI